MLSRGNLLLEDARILPLPSLPPPPLETKDEAEWIGNLKGSSRRNKEEKKVNKIKLR